MKIHFNLTDKNSTLQLKKIIDEAKNNSKIVFSDKNYDFFKEGATVEEVYPSNNDGGIRTVPIFVRNKKNFVLDGKGAKFIFHGKTSPIVLENCENITLKNFTIDFAFPMVYQAKVTACTDEYIDIKIDSENFPYKVENSNVIYKLEEIDYDSESTYIFDYDNDSDIGRPSYIMAHFSTGHNADRFKDSGIDRVIEGVAYPRNLLFDAIDTGKNSVRLKYRDNSARLFYPVNSRLVLHITESNRENDTIFVNRCKNVLIDNVTIKRGPSMGVIAQLTENITVNKMKIIPDERRKDLVTTTADSNMFVDCSGLVKVCNSYISCSVDDGINVHGTYTLVDKINKNTIKAKIGHHQQKGYNPYLAGDEVQFSKAESLLNLGSAKVISSTLSEDKCFINIEFDKLPEKVKKGDLFTNYSRTPTVKIVNNEYYRSTCLLIASPRKITFKNNKVYTLCGALRIKDDPNVWYESGKVNDMLIKNNTFYHCGEWSDSYLINILTRENAKTLSDSVHSNIKITGNKFIGRNAKLVCAEETDGLIIKNNRYKQDKIRTRKVNYSPFLIKNSKNVLIKDNTLED